MKKIISIIITIMLFFNFAACADKKETRYEAQFLMLFDTVTKIVAYMDNKEDFTKLAQLIYDNLKQYHELYDIYNSYDGINNIKTINDNAGIAPVKVDKKIIDLLIFAKQCYSLTDGKMNIAMGSVLKIWHDYRTRGIDDPQNASLPAIQELEAAAAHTSIEDVIIDEENSTVFLKDPHMSLDVGAVAKGYATEQVSQVVMENGYTSALVSVGGNIRALGNKGKGQPWNVGVQNPDKESEESILKVVNLTDSSLVTSGSYGRYYTVNGKNYHHIIDPDTLFPAEYFKSVTIKCSDSSMADVLSTAVFNMTFEKGFELIDSLDFAEAMWVLNDGQIKYSAKFNDIIKK